MTTYSGTKEFEGATFVKASFKGANLRFSDVSGVTMRSVDVDGLDIDSHDLFFGSLFVNGVDVVPLVDAELNRQFPGRELQKAQTPEGLRDGWVDWGSDAHRRRRPGSAPPRRVRCRAGPSGATQSPALFLEAFSGAAPGDVLVVDNGGREDEACLGDLIVLEAQAAGVGGVAVWGLHRDTAELTQIALPVFSYGRCPAGPVRLDEQEPSALASAWFGACLVTRDDIVFGDDDGVVFVAASQAGEVLAAARQIGDVEQDQARKIQAGQTLRQQTAFSEYLTRRAAEPSYTFRRHLRRIGGAIEE